MMAGTQIPEQRKWRAKGPMWAGYLSIIALVLGFGSWSIMTTIAGAIIAPGQIEVEQNRQIVQHPTGGVVGKIFAQEGSEVTEGDILLRLDDTRLNSELAVIESQYFELIARRGRLEAERDDLIAVDFDERLIDAAKTNPELQALMEGQARLFEARRTSQLREAEQMSERKVQIAAQIDGFAAQHTAMSRQLELLKEELADQENLLKKGLAQASRVSALRREEARLEGSIGEIIASKAEIAGRMVETEIGILRLSTNRREDAITRSRDIGYRELELSEKRILLLDSLSHLDIRAPASGSVYDMQIHAIRSVVRPAEPVMFIVPRDRPLVITSRIEPIHIDKVYVGQPVTLRFSTFDQRTTPELFGKVVKLSADAFVDKATNQSYYRAEIVPNPEEYSKLAGLDLLPGMPVESFIRTADRTPLNFLIKPVADYFNKSFRED